MSNSLGTINAVAGWIPSKVRGVIYALIGLFWLVEAIWDILPNTETGSRIAATITLVASIMAVVNTDLVPDPRPPVLTDEELEEARRNNDAGESTLVTIFLVLAIVVLVLFLIGAVR